MQVVCKYYIDISRYRDATGYIREGLDLTQLHFSSRRMCLFLLDQINADLVASCFTEGDSRIKIAEHFIKPEEIKIKNANDLIIFKNYTYLNYLLIFKEIKLFNFQSTTKAEQLSFSESLLKKLKAIKNVLACDRYLMEYCKDLLIDIYLTICGFLREINDKNQLVQLLKEVKPFILTDSQHSTSLQQKWHQAEFYCSLFEADNSNKQYLEIASEIIKNNPHPSLYRRICFNLFKNEKENNLKVSYLLETQSIALRHKACSIQIKQKRKSTIEPNMFNKVMNSLSFDSLNSNYLNKFVNEILPNNCVVVGLVLSDMNDLYIIRLERSKDPFLYKLKYNQKYNEEFKQIMNENDRSMKQSDRAKFWSARNSLNKRLYTFLADLEENIFSFSKSLLLGSYIEKDLNYLLELLKKDLKLTFLNQNQTTLLEIILLGVEIYSVEEIRNGLKNEFKEAQIDEILYYLLEKKEEFSNFKRKHVCLLIDKVNISDINILLNMYF